MRSRRGDTRWLLTGISARAEVKLAAGTWHIPFGAFRDDARIATNSSARPRRAQIHHRVEFAAVIRVIGDTPQYIVCAGLPRPALAVATAGIPPTSSKP